VISWKVPPQQTLTSAIYLCLAGSQETTMHFGIQIMKLIQPPENPCTPTGRKSERTHYLACLSLLTETGHVWRR